MALADNLIAAWELDESSGNALDSHGSNDLTDNATVGSGTGQVNATARDFETANSEYFSLADNTDLSTGDIDFTFECWVKLESSGDNIIVGKDASGNREYVIDFPTGEKPRFYCNGGGSILVQWGSALSTATWYQIIAWHDAAANEAGIVVNAGTPVTSATGGTAPNDMGAEFRIGARAFAGFEGYFDGLIGPVRFWKRVLTGAERTELFNSGAGRTYAYITGGGAIEGTGSATLAGITGSAAGALALAGSASATLAGASGSAAGVLPITGSAGSALDGVSGSAAGVVALAGAGAAALAGVAGSAVGALAITAAAAATFAGVSGAAHGGEAGETGAGQRTVLRSRDTSRTVLTSRDTSRTVLTSRDTSRTRL